LVDSNEYISNNDKSSDSVDIKNYTNARWGEGGEGGIGGLIFERNLGMKWFKKSFRKKTRQMSPNVADKHENP
jgi:hypothetical protein